MSAVKLNIIILAAGQGSRMKSRLPKVLHPLAGQPLLNHVIKTARSLNPERIIVVYGHGGEQVPDAITGDDLVWVKQAEQLGTGHAVAQAMPEVDDAATVLVLYGDVPLTRQGTLMELVSDGADDFGLLTVHLDDPGSYGRIVRNKKAQVTHIVEHKDATAEEHRITEVNTGILATNAGRLRSWLEKLNNDNAQSEYYLTDVIAMAVADGIKIKTSHPDSEMEVLGVNSRAQLAMLERQYQRQQAEALMAQGVTVIDPARIDIRGEVTIAPDVILDVNVVLVGRVSIAEGVYIGPGCVIKDSHIAEGVQMQPMCVIEQASIGADARIGPFARLRPGADLSANTHVGNFVEIKNSKVGEASKINHLSYIGDSDVGARVNIGAGVITCNYDGAYKHRTTIGNDVFVGSDCQLVAPVEVGEGATLGAGTTLTRDAPAGDLTLSRSKQKTVQGWKRPTKKGRVTSDE